MAESFGENKMNKSYCSVEKAISDSKWDKFSSWVDLAGNDNASWMDDIGPVVK